MDTLPHILQNERQIAERFGVKARVLQRWRFKRRYDHRYPRYYKVAGGKSVYYYLDEFAEDLTAVIVEVEPRPMRY